MKITLRGLIGIICLIVVDVELFFYFFSVAFIPFLHIIDVHNLSKTLFIPLGLLHYSLLSWIIIVLLTHSLNNYLFNWLNLEKEFGGKKK